MSKNDDAQNPYEYTDFGSYEDFLISRDEELEMEDREKAAIKKEIMEKKKDQIKGTKISSPNYLDVIIAIVVIGFLAFVAFNFFRTIFK